jgi:DNA-binding MarR family transcriptional regulator
MSPEELADGLVTTAVRLTRRLRAEDRGARLTGPQASALAVVVYSRRIKVSDLATLEQVSRPTISKTVQDLEAAGLVRRSQDAHDGRVSWLEPTRKGETLLADGQARRIAPLVRQLASLSAEDRKLLSKALALLRALTDG